MLLLNCRHFAVVTRHSRRLVSSVTASAISIADKLSPKHENRYDDQICILVDKQDNLVGQARRQVCHQWENIEHGPGDNLFCKVDSTFY